MIAHSMLLIVTAGSMIPSTHEPSHGAGQTRPVNSGKVVRLVQPVERLAPAAAIDEIVPLGDQVVDRAAGGHVGHQVARVAERNAAIHAARPLVSQLAVAQVLVELVPIEDAQGRIALGRRLSRELGEAGRLAHRLDSFCVWSSVSDAVRMAVRLAKACFEVVDDRQWCETSLAAMFRSGFEIQVGIPLTSVTAGRPAMRRLRAVGSASGSGDVVGRSPAGCSLASCSRARL